MVVPDIWYMDAGCIILNYMMFYDQPGNDNPWPHLNFRVLYSAKQYMIDFLSYIGHLSY